MASHKRKRRDRSQRSTAPAGPDIQVATTAPAAVCTRSVLPDESSPREESRDVSLIRRALRDGWNIPADLRQEVVERLATIIRRESVTVLTASGESVDLHGPADCNAIAAAKVIVAMVAFDQKTGPSQPIDVEYGTPEYWRLRREELGPMTEQNLEQHRALLLEQMNGLH